MFRAKITEAKNKFVTDMKQIKWPPILEEDRIFQRRVSKLKQQMAHTYVDLIYSANDIRKDNPKKALRSWQGLRNMVDSNCRKGLREATELSEIANMEKADTPGDSWQWPAIQTKWAQLHLSFLEAIDAEMKQLIS